MIGENRYGTGIFSGSVDFHGQLSIQAGTLPVPYRDADVVTLTSPFVLTGSIGLEPTVALPGFQADVTGSGIARLVLSRDAPGAYRFAAITYTVQDPVPEPASLLLFASGLTVLAIRRRSEAALRS